MRAFKLVGTATVVSLVVFAVAAASALASYHAEVETSNTKGTQIGENALTTDVGNVQCTTATFFVQGVKGTKLGAGDYTAATLLVNGAYGKATGVGKCTLGGLPVLVETIPNKCSFELTTAVSKVASNIKIVCDAGSILIKDTTGLKCEIVVSPQTTSGGVSFANLGTGATREVQATFAVTGIAYSWTASCPAAMGKAGKNTNGTYTGKIDLEGEDPTTKAQIGVWVG
jgi:hypothetical protein